MRAGSFAVAVCLLLAAQVRAADPPQPVVTFQTQSPSQILDDLRFAADAIGGDKGKAVVLKELKSIFGEKGIDGVDLNKPVVGYAFGALKLEEFTVVIALPVTGEKDFLAMCDRINKQKLTVDAKDKTLYHLPPLNRRSKAMLRFSDGYAYIAYGKNPAPHFDAKALIPVAKLHDPADRALFTGRVHFERDPFGSKAAGWVGAEFARIAIDMVFRNFWFGGIREIGDALDKGVEKSMFRFLLNSDAESFVARVSLDRATGNIVAEATLTPKPNTQLAKDIAAFKLPPNRFASLTNHPDTAAAIHGRLPLFTADIRSTVIAEFEKTLKEIEMVPGPDKAIGNELFKGLIRTAKDGDIDVAVALRGPNKDGDFTVIGGVAFDDPAALEKEAKALFNKEAPEAIKERMKWDADKAGKIAIHTFHIPEKELGKITKAFGGEKCLAAFAFAPQGLIGVVGPDPVPVLKDVLTAKPADGPWLEVVANSGRIVKVFEKVMGPNHRETTEVVNLFGKDDKKLQALATTLEGGKQLKATVTMSLKVLPRILWFAGIREEPERPVEPVPVELKK